MQEYHRARHRVFRCGALIIPCETLSETIEGMGRYFTLKSPIVGFRSVSPGTWNHPAAGLLFNSLDIVLTERPLIELLAKTSGLLCSDKCVRVFSLIGLCSDADITLIDYNTAFWDILQDITTRAIHTMLSSPEPHDIFQLLCVVHRSDSIEGLCSRVLTFDGPSSFLTPIGIFKMEQALKTTPRISFRNPKVGILRL